MKIIHELFGEPQTTISGQVYGCPVAKPPKWTGMRVEALIVDTSMETTHNGALNMIEGDAIYIEGDAKSVRTALEDLLAQLDGLEQLRREEFERDAALYVQCATCRMWAHPKYDTHGDGKGNTCQLPPKEGK